MTEQLSLFPSDQARWDRALLALDELNVEAAQACLACEPDDRAERAELRAMRDALAFLATVSLGPNSGAAALSEALWQLPARASGCGLSKAGTSKALEALARRITSLASRQPDDSRLFEPAVLARARLILGQEGLAGEALRRGSERKQLGARELYCLGDLWSAQRHEDAGLAYGRALALDPRAFEPIWTTNERLRSTFEELAAATGADEARDRLLAEAWWRRIVELPTRDPEWAEVCRSARIAAGREPATAARRFSLLLAEDVASTSPDPERREEQHALDPELFARVFERLRGLGRS